VILARPFVAGSGALCLAAVALPLVGPAAAANIEAGKVKAKPCNTCHGKNGIGTMPHFPNLAGQKALYVEQQLKAFRAGTRQSEIMNIVVKKLSDQDIEDLAAYYESLRPSYPNE
jgi:cytochrome c553